VIKQQKTTGLKKELERLKGVEAENERLKKELERLKGVEAENERLKGVEAELKKMTRDWVDRCEVLERVEERADWAEEELKIVNKQLEELEETPNETLTVKLEQKKERIKQLKEAYFDLKAEAEQKDERIKELEEQLEEQANSTVEPVKKKKSVKRSKAVYYPGVDDSKCIKWLKGFNSAQLQRIEEVYENKWIIKWGQNIKGVGTGSYLEYENYRNETTAQASKNKGMVNNEICRAFKMGYITCVERVLEPLEAAYGEEVIDFEKLE
jgi:DNA repair exonuclease SbcCD ATPase subunit